MSDVILDTDFLQFNWREADFPLDIYLPNPAPSPEKASRAVTIDPLPVGVLPAVGVIVTGRISRAPYAGLKDGDWFRGEITETVAGDVMIATNWNGLNFFGCVYPYDTARVGMHGDKGNVLLDGRYSLIKIAMRRPATGKTWRPMMTKERNHAAIEARYQGLLAKRAANKARQEMATPSSAKAA